MFENPKKGELLHPKEWKELIAALQTKEEAHSLITALDIQLGLVEGGRKDAQAALKDADKIPPSRWRDHILGLGRDSAALKRLRKMIELKAATLPG